MVAELPFVMAAQVDVATTYAPSEMPRRTTRLINVMLGAVGVLFVALGVALTASLLQTR